MQGEKTACLTDENTTRRDWVLVKRFFFQSQI
jgi:hypothetical protein